MTALDERTLVFQVTPWRDSRVSRTVELRADQTLHDLHLAIQNVFELDNDHLYAFFLNNQPWNRTFEFGGPNVESAPHEATSTPLGMLPLRKNKRFLYLFDFGDELRHEVRVVDEGPADANARYPRIIESVGTAPRQYSGVDEDYEDERPNHQEPPQMDPALAELVPSVREALARYAPRRFEAPGTAARPESELRAEVDLAIALLDRSAGSLERIHALEHAVEGYVWGWLGDLPLELSLAGLTEDGLRLGVRVQEIFRHPPILFTIPLLFALAGQPEKARDYVEQNLAEYPDDPLMLLRAGQTFRVLGDFGRAEEAFRDALCWVGGNSQRRREIIGGLEQVLHALGREAAVTELLDEERREQERRRQEQSREWPQPYRRQSPKVGRNDLCPCGSGKKVKRCCGTKSGA